MLASVMDYIPIGLPFFLAFWFLFGLLAILFQIGVLRFVFASMGVNRRYMFALLICCLLGSYINIPVAQLPAEQMSSGEIVNYFGMRYIVPVLVSSPRTGSAVNL